MDTTSTPQESGQPQVVYIRKESAAQDSNSFGWALLGFFIPVVGLVLWLVWKDDKPKVAKRCIHGAIVGVLFIVLVYVVGACSSAVILSRY